MELITISDNTVINMDRIDAVELITTKKGKSVVIYVNGTRFIATKNIADLFGRLNEPDLSRQYFAG